MKIQDCCEGWLGQNGRMRCLVPYFSIAEAQMNIEELTERAQKGETIIVIDGPDDRPVAQLLPVEPVES